MWNGHQATMSVTVSNKSNNSKHNGEIKEFSNRTWEIVNKYEILWKPV